MLKTITVFLIADKSTMSLLSPTSLSEALPQPTIVDPLKTQWGVAGFSCPSHFGQTTVFVGADNTRVLNVQVRERVLPAKVIRTHLEERITSDHKRQGYKPGRKQIAELKEAVTMELLPTSHIRHVDTEVMITGNYLLIGTGSARVVDVVVSQLQGLFPDDDLALMPINWNRDVGKFLMDALLDETTDGYNFNRGGAVTLKSSAKAVARFKGIELDVDSVKERVSAGMKPVDLAIEYSDTMTFTLTDQMLIKSIRFSDVLLSQTHDTESVVDEFDATTALVSGELRHMLTELLKAIPARDELEQTADDDEDDEL